MPDLTLHHEDVELLETITRMAKERMRDMAMADLTNDAARIAMRRYSVLADKLADRLQQGLHPRRPEV